MADTEFKIAFHSSMSSVTGLQNTCIENEINLNAKLESLDIVQKPDGQKLTEAIFVEQTGHAGLGRLTIKKTSPNETQPAFKGKAFILTQPVDVSVFRTNILVG